MSGAVDTNYLLAIPVINVGPLITADALGAIYGLRAAQEVRWRGHNPADLAGNLGGVVLRVTTADGIPAAPEGSPLNPGELANCAVENAIHQMNLDVEQRLTASGIRHEWVDYGRGCHTIWNFRRQFGDALSPLEQVFAAPRPDPQVISYRSIASRFTVWGWQIGADPKRALEFLQMTGASSTGLTLTGSGTTSVITPPFFRGLRAVDLISSGGARTLTPDGAGRLHFTVDLGPPHQDQEYTLSAALAGESTAAYFTTRSVAFAPHAVIVLTTIRPGPTGVLACTRSLGPEITHARITLADARNRPVTPSRAIGLSDHTRCLRLRLPRRLHPGRYAIQVTGTDAFGHRVGTRRRTRLGPGWPAIDDRTFGKAGRFAQ